MAACIRRFVVLSGLGAPTRTPSTEPLPKRLVLHATLWIHTDAADKSGDGGSNPVCSVYLRRDTLMQSYAGSNFGSACASDAPGMPSSTVVLHTCGKAPVR